MPPRISRPFRPVASCGRRGGQITSAAPLIAAGRRAPQITRSRRARRAGSSVSHRRVLAEGGGWRRGWPGPRTANQCCVPPAPCVVCGRVGTRRDERRPSALPVPRAPPAPTRAVHDGSSETLRRRAGGDSDPPGRESEIHARDTEVSRNLAASTRAQKSENVPSNSLPIMPTTKPQISNNANRAGSFTIRMRYRTSSAYCVLITLICHDQSRTH